MELDNMESRTYIIGREGHIYLNDKSVSKQHAEIQIMNGEIYLRDLHSTNGTYLVKNNRLVAFAEGYVQINQPIVIGSKQYTIRKLLEMAGALAA
ncbi:MAG: FHA domain-containing protein [Gammaproteobacteria bacterium]|jgi:pSer/pThr/pTyr-binding forkhead associated (FHA) protein|nr:FHA domain-containing protein [Gammaproteobacteria bacterium]MBT3724988.1 FHA domain-containing protein [Gammaproteobacteria bacterium]MBT4075385.1 FHA domain-containing protein [Gammaproteobacteria bacterium]MBT4194710.1 FHA domain-containing protein [Gammaproteobacteria bacterium]MBT4449700.1 FHA domain-containing protein [Gammaproteobacteria bacterium]